MKRILIVVLFVGLLLCGTQVYASDAMAVVSDTLDDGSIEAGKPFLLDIYFYNDFGEMTGISIPFAFYSPVGDSNITAITHVSFSDSVATGWNVYNAWSEPFVTEGDDSSIVMYNGWESMWTMVEVWYAETDGWDGTLPDTVNFSGIAMNGWLASDTTKYLGFVLQIDQEGLFCIDSADHDDNTYDWLFDDLDLKFNGPYCWFVDDLTDVTELDQELLPTEFALDQNYPNPFNPSTNLQIAVPRRSNVNITIYNVLGQKVKDLVNREFEAGFYEIQWNSTNNNGSEVASGMYFYKIEAGDFTDTKKMMLLK